MRLYDSHRMQILLFHICGESTTLSLRAVTVHLVWLSRLQRLPHRRNLKVNCQSLASHLNAMSANRPDPAIELC